MRKLFTTEDAYGRGLTSHTLRWGEKTGPWRRIERGVYGEGPEPPSPLDRARARVLATSSPASGALAGVLLGLDDTWEPALESALRTKLTTVAELAAALPELGGARVPWHEPHATRPGAASARCAPDESVLETLLLQLARTVPALGELDRQVEVFDQHGIFVAQVDLAKVALGVFFELDGQQHKEQPVYDASRETAVVAATGWLCGRFTWHEVTRTPTTTARRLTGVAEQAARRPYRRAS